MRQGRGSWETGKMPDEVCESGYGQTPCVREIVGSDAVIKMFV